MSKKFFKDMNYCFGCEKADCPFCWSEATKKCSPEHYIKVSMKSKKKK